MARTKGAVAKGVDNKIVRDYLLAHGPLRNQKQVVDDSIRGAKGQEEESHRYSNERLFTMLTRLDYIDTKTVLAQMHAYNLAKGNEDIPSLRNVQRITRVLRCASQAIQYHAKNGIKMNAIFRSQTSPSLNSLTMSARNFGFGLMRGNGIK